MKVLAFTNLFPRAPRRAQETVRPDDLVSTFLALARHCDVRVVAPRPAWRMLDRPLDLVRLRRERATGLEAVFPPYYSIPGVHCLHASAMALSLKAPLRALNEQFPWDVVVAAWAYPDAAAAAHFARWWDTPLVTMALGTDLHVLPTYFGLRPQIQWGLSRSSRVVVVTRALAERAIELGVSRERLVLHQRAPGSSWDAVGKRHFQMLEKVLAEWREERATVVKTYPK